MSMLSVHTVAAEITAHKARFVACMTKELSMYYISVHGNRVERGAMGLRVCRVCGRVRWCLLDRLPYGITMACP